MKLSVVKIDGAIHPMGEYSQDELKRMVAGKEYIANITMHRNVRFHRLFFALVKTIFDSQEYFDDMEVFRKYLIMKVGRVIVIDTPKGTMFLPESISFEKMSQEDFEKLYQAIVTYAVKEYSQDEKTLNNLMEFA